MPNPKGNPKTLKPITTDRDEPLTRQVAIRVTEAVYQALQSLGDKKAEFCRDAIKKALDDCSGDSRG
ncbi:hypothetical protein VB711_25185 [Cronbergia sp. UHCC 0137]|uniref:hypothetical protein n=1 Tax=Cronbergia sp. UHCC 0137 TaxID=3110239 RepID=UPI002B21D8DD|nr:hypothetical protein [Cronbergia sp. UHCC 0137]MEA5621102.1 hypothetical protein [Cronbergia sp. UHCC 0137]